MTQDRIVQFRMKPEPISGSVTFPNDALYLPGTKPHHGPQWGFMAPARIDGEPDPVAVNVSLVADIADEPDSLGWLDRSDDGISGKFVIGHDWQLAVQHAAFSPLAWEIDIAFATDRDGEILRLSLGMRRRQGEP